MFVKSEFYDLVHWSLGHLSIVLWLTYSDTYQLLENLDSEITDSRLILFWC
jgi:hypothetical protein